MSRCRNDVSTVFQVSTFQQSLSGSLEIDSLMPGLRYVIIKMAVSREVSEFHCQDKNYTQTHGHIDNLSTGLTDLIKKRKRKTISKTMTATHDKRQGYLDITECHGTLNGL